jgi:hypothetical protein
MFYGKLYDVSRDLGATVSVEDGNRIAGTIYASWRRQSGNGCADELAAPADHEVFLLAASPTVLAAANLKSLGLKTYHPCLYENDIFTLMNGHANQLGLRMEKEGARWCRWSSKPVWGP